MIHIQKYKVIILRSIVLLCLIWMGISFFPIMNIEGDSALFSAGCERMYQNGVFFPPDFHYEWNMQPLVAMLVIGIKFLLPIFSCESIYYVLTVLFSVLYLFLASFFASKLTNIKWEYCFIILMFFPENYAIATYSNTAIFASVFSLAGFYLMIAEEKLYIKLLAVFSLGVAPLFRVDVLAIYPVVFPLFLYKQYHWRKAIAYTFVCAVAILIITSFGFWMFKANPLATFTHYQTLVEQSTGNFSWEHFFRINAGFYSAAGLIFLVFGLYYLIKNKRYILIFICLIPIGILYFLMKDFNGAAGKHIQYSVAFLVVTSVIGAKYIVDKIIVNHKWITVLLVIIIIIPLFLGIRIYPKSKPWLEKTYSVLYPQPTLIKLCEVNIDRIGKIECVIGAGQPLNTADEILMFTGRFFYPYYIHNIKNRESIERKYFVSELDKIHKADTMFVMTTQSSDWILAQQLHGLGFRIIDGTNLNSFSWGGFYYFRSADEKTIYVKAYNIDKDPVSFNEAFNYFDYHSFYLKSRWDWQMYLVNENKTKAIPLTDSWAIINLK